MNAAAIVSTRETAAKALLHGLLDETTYCLVRRHAILHDCRRSQPYIAAMRQNDPGYAEGFCNLADKWENR